MAMRGNVPTCSCTKLTTANRGASLCPTIRNLMLPTSTYTVKHYSPNFRIMRRCRAGAGRYGCQILPQDTGTSAAVDSAYGTHLVWCLRGICNTFPPLVWSISVTNRRDICAVFQNRSSGPKILTPVHTTWLLEHVHTWLPRGSYAPSLCGTPCKHTVLRVW